MHQKSCRAHNTAARNNQSYQRYWLCRCTASVVESTTTAASTPWIALGSQIYCGSEAKCQRASFRKTLNSCQLYDCCSAADLHLWPVCAGMQACKSSIWIIIFRKSLFSHRHLSVCNIMVHIYSIYITGSQKAYSSTSVLTGGPGLPCAQQRKWLWWRSEWHWWAGSAHRSPP